ncbi:MAG: DUF151 domain-containing protein [Candidatus Aenigmatarchaeota archaeon]
MNLKNLFIFVLIFLFVAFLVFKSSSFQEREELKILDTFEEKTNETYTVYNVDTKGFIKARINVDYIVGDVAEISLIADCYLIKATTDAFIGNAIIKGQEKKIEFRPSIYDVITDTFKSLGIQVLALKIVDMKNNTYIGQLILQHREKVLFLDIRPSDGSAIAVRFDAPIYINESLAKKMGEYIC